jgi:hypothetical protein
MSQGVFDQLVKDVTAAKLANPTYDFVITGHSLGMRYRVFNQQAALRQSCLLYIFLYFSLRLKSTLSTRLVCPIIAIRSLLTMRRSKSEPIRSFELYRPMISFLSTDLETLVNTLRSSGRFILQMPLSLSLSNARKRMLVPLPLDATRSPGTTTPSIYFLSNLKLCRDSD